MTARARRGPRGRRRRPRRRAAGLSVALGFGGRRVDLLPRPPFRTATARGRRAGSPARWARGLARAPRGGHPRVAGELGDPAAIARLTTEGPERLAQLLALGARFDRDPSGQLDLAREAAHSRARVLHARDATGAEVVRALGASLGERSGLSVFERAFALELVRDGGRVAGVLARHADGALVLHRARAVVLATGGIGQVFARTTNPPEATGDGLALAWRAGARLADLEFVQFHPTALDVGADPMPLLTEALRGAGATLVDEAGRRLLADAGPQAELLPRDVVARALWSRASPSGTPRAPRRPRGGGGGVPGALPDRLRGLPAARPRPARRDRSPWPRPRTTTWAASTWTSRAGRACPASGPRARWPAPASTGPTAWPATRSSRRSSSAHGWRAAWARPCRTCVGRPTRSTCRHRRSLATTSRPPPRTPESAGSCGRGSGCARRGRPARGPRRDRGPGRLDPGGRLGGAATGPRWPAWS